MARHQEYLPLNDGLGYNEQPHGHNPNEWNSLPDDIAPPISQAEHYVGEELREYAKTLPPYDASLDEGSSIAAAQNADVDAQEQVITNNLRLVPLIIARNNFFMARATERDNLFDLIQTGNLALYDALRKYRSEVGVKFSTYAGVWIYKNITRFLNGSPSDLHEADLLRVPTNHQTYYLVTSVVRTFQSEGNANPTKAEILAASNFTKEQVDEYFETLRGREVVALEQNKSEALTVADHRAAEMLDDVEDKIGINSAHRWQVIKPWLTPREQAIFRMRSDGATLDEIARSIDIVTAERIRQIQEKTLPRLLKNPAICHGLGIMTPLHPGFDYKRHWRGPADEFVLESLPSPRAIRDQNAQLYREDPTAYFEAGGRTVWLPERSRT